MTGRAAAVRNRLLVAVAAILLAWLFGWTSDEGLVALLVALVALALAAVQAWCGGLGVVSQWLLRYRHSGIGVRALGDIIGEHHDDMVRAGLVVPRPRRFHQAWVSWRRRRPPRPLPDLVPRLRHRPVDGGILVSLEAVRAGMSQDDIVRAVPRLRSAWGVDVIRARPLPGGRVVDLWIPLTDEARADAEHDDADGLGDLDDLGDLDELAPTSPRVGRDRPAVRRPATRDPQRRLPPISPARPPDAPTIVVAGRGERQPRREPDAPPRFQPRLEPDERGRYELTVLPPDAARTFEPRPLEDPRSVEASPRTDEIPVVEAPTSLPARVPPPPQTSRQPELNGGDRVNPTDVDERHLRLGPHWRVGKER